MSNQYWCPGDGWFRADNDGQGACPECGRLGEPPREAPTEPPGQEAE